mgnify:CR=1 FL=1
MSDEKLVDGFGEVEKDAIGEIMNITMGSAATAVSNMLSAKVWITTPTVTVVSAKDLSFPELEPSIMVKIKYIQGVEGQNVLVLKQNDVQLILDQLMGLPLEVTDDFKFDEMNISAVCEVMNQMMGASATALSEIIDTTIDISTPEAIVQDNGTTVSSLYDLSENDNVVSIKFNLTIDGVINSEFISVLSLDLAKEMAKKMMAGYGGVLEDTAKPAEPAPAPQPAAPAADPSASSAGGTLSQAEIEALINGSAAAAPSANSTPAAGTAAPDMNMGMQMPGNMPNNAMPNNTMSNNMGMQNNGMMPNNAMPNQPMQNMSMPNQQMQGNMMGMQGSNMPGNMPNNMGMQQYGYDPNMQQNSPYGMYPQQMNGQMQPNMYGQPYGQQYNQPYSQPAVNIQPVKLQNFESNEKSNLTQEQNNNLNLLMGVPLNVSVEIGSTTKKVKEILEFSQGTIIELERQAGAPVDIIVNGNLIAKGDVVVIDDNFAVRITEIIKSKFLDNLGKE